MPCHSRRLQVENCGLGMQKRAGDPPAKTVQLSTQPSLRPQFVQEKNRLEPAKAVEHTYPPCEEASISLLKTQEIPPRYIIYPLSFPKDWLSINERALIRIFLLGRQWL